MKEMKCAICDATKYLFYDYLDFFGNPVALYKCIRCGHGSHDFEYSVNDFKNLYREAYAASYIESSDEIYLKRQIQYKLDVKYLTQFHDANKLPRVLDYGCSSGNFLDAMPVDWIKVGYEVNPSHIAHIKLNKPSIKIFDQISNIDGKFDLIVMRGVIEHIQNHNNLIDFLFEKIVVGGGLFISATPDFSSFPASFYKDGWSQVKCPEHIHQFTSTSLTFLLAKAGLVLKCLAHPYVETPYANWEKDSRSFLSNVTKEDAHEYLSETSHAFPGNMMTAYFEKVE
jgi:2-polyprenyl-3-methyl-5-hydroxy-6-metoxy-1,4-benzoquinol methylase